MRILTVRQPWAWAIIHAGKNVENRTRNLAGDYRGPVAIHAGRVAVDGEDNLWNAPLFFDALRAAPSESRKAMSVRGAIIGVVDLVDVHHAAECVYVGPVVEDFDGNFISQDVTHCSAWAEDANVYHLELADPRALATPLAYRGGLGLRRLDVGTEQLVTEGLA